MLQSELLRNEGLTEVRNCYHGNQLFADYSGLLLGGEKLKILRLKRSIDDIFAIESFEITHNRSNEKFAYNKGRPTLLSSRKITMLHTHLSNWV